MIKSILISVIYWTCFLMIVVTIRFIGIEFFTGTPLNFPIVLIYTNSIPGGVLMGLLWSLLDYVDKKLPHKHKRSFGATVILKSLTYFLIFIFVTFIASLAASSSLQYARNYIFSTISFGNLLAAFIGAFIYIFFQQMNKKFGPGILWKYLTGKYFHPRDEERIFLFMDLKSSTTIAEKVGHIQYSQFIQDCFRELTGPVLDHHGEVYQYVGDEVIITWETATGIKDFNCLNFFYDFQEKLKDREVFFDKVYGFHPVFKAGISVGMVTAVEVGELKSEIAYHGDVLNTASRIQGLCNQLEEPFLASEALIRIIPANEIYEIKQHGAFELRGKQEMVEIFGLRKVIDSSKIFM